MKDISKQNECVSLNLCVRPGVCVRMCVEVKVHKEVLSDANKELMNDRRAQKCVHQRGKKKLKM